MNAESIENVEQIKSSLQDLIYRLQDAEKGYEEIKKASNNLIVNKWLDAYAKERHLMHFVLEEEMKNLGGDPEVKSTFLGEIHRMFIDVKINATSNHAEFNAIVDEIDRGASLLISEYEKVIEEVEMPSSIKKILIGQKLIVEKELSTLTSLRDEINSETIA